MTPHQDTSVYVLLGVEPTPVTQTGTGLYQGDGCQPVRAGGLLAAVRSDCRGTAVNLSALAACWRRLFQKENAPFLARSGALWRVSLVKCEIIRRRLLRALWRLFMALSERKKTAAVFRRRLLACFARVMRQSERRRQQRRRLCRAFRRRP